MMGTQTLFTTCMALARCSGWRESWAVGTSMRQALAEKGHKHQQCKNTGTGIVSATGIGNVIKISSRAFGRTI